MKQFHDVEWSDFGNHTAFHGLRVPKQKHKGTRRKCCAETGALRQKLANAAAGEASYQPAAESVQVVKAAFATARLAASRQETRVRIRLLFDSFSQPGQAGIRSAATRIRQMLYRADPYQIDIRIELQPEQDRIIVIGQLVDLTHPEMVGRDVQVMLSDGREYIVNTLTNEFGEFCAEVKNSGDLELSLLGRSGKPIIILLRGALDQFSEAKD